MPSQSDQSRKKLPTTHGTALFMRGKSEMRNDYLWDSKNCKIKPEKDRVPSHFFFMKGKNEMINDYFWGSKKHKNKLEKYRVP